MAKSKRYILYFLLALAASAFSQATPQRTSMSGIVVDAESGENSFCSCKDGKHKYVVKNKDNEYYKKQITDLIF